MGKKKKIHRIATTVSYILVAVCMHVIGLSQVQLSYLVNQQSSIIMLYCFASAILERTSNKNKEEMKICKICLISSRKKSKNAKTGTKRLERGLTP